MISFVTVLVSSLVFTSIPSLAAPVGSRDLHLRTMRGQVDAVVSRNEQPVARATNPNLRVIPELPPREAPALRAVTVDLPAGNEVKRDALETPRRRRHARDLLLAREIPDVPARRNIIFARDDVAPRNHHTSKEVSAAPSNTETKRDASPEVEVKRGVSAPAEIKRDTVPATEVKREVTAEVKRGVIPVQATQSRARSVKFAAAAVTKREPIKLISAFKREIKKLD